MKFSLKLGDTLPVIETTLTQDGTPINLTDCSVVWRYRPADDPGADAIERTMNIETPASAGKVTYTWQETDSDTAGDYFAEIVVTYPDDRVQTFPNRDYMNFQIVNNLKTVKVTTT